MQVYTENIFYHYILSNYELCLMSKPEFFTSKNLQSLFTIAKEYVLKYRVAPSCDQVKELVKISGKSETIPSDIIDILYKSKESLSQYTEEWLQNTTKAWATWENFTGNVKNTISYIKSVENNVTDENVGDICERAKGIFNRNCILTFDESRGSDFFDPESHKQDKLARTSLQYDYINTCTDGGSWAGSLIVFMAPPKVGKSLWLQNICAKSVTAGVNCAYVSLELPEQMIIQRIGSNLLSIPSLEYKKVAEDTQLMKDKLTKYRNSTLNKIGAMWIKQFPTSTLSTNELEDALLKEEEMRSTPDHPFKFKQIFVDYLNIMKNWRNQNTENTYMKIKQIAEDLKGIAIKNGWDIITATQSNKAGWETTDMDVTNTSESSGLNATVDMLFAIIADSQMRLAGKYKLKCLLSRVAPFNDTFKMFNFNKTYLRIEEDMTTGIQEASTAIPQNIYRNGNNTAKNSVTNIFPQNGNIINNNATQSPNFSDTISITGNGLFKLDK